MEPRKFKIGINVSPEDWEKIIQSGNFAPADIFSSAVRVMNFSYDCVIDSGNSKLLPNGTRTGLYGLLERSEVDFVPLLIPVSTENWELMAYNYPYECEELTFVTRKPTYNPEIMAIFQTISASVWLSLLISIILVTLIFFTVLKYRYTLEDVILHVLAIALNQEGYIIPKKAGEVLMIGTWLLAMMLFTTCFKSVLLSFLSFPSVTSVKTVPELADAIRAGKYMAMTTDFLPLLAYIHKTSPNEDNVLIAQNVYENLKILKHKPPSDLGDLFNESYSNVAIVSLRSSMKLAGEALFVSEDSMYFYWKATVVSKDFCCKDEIDMVTLRYLAAGMNLKIDRIFDHKKVYDIPDDDKFRKITLTDISGAFIFLIAGYCLSTVVLIIELRIKSREMLLSSAI